MKRLKKTSLIGLLLAGTFFITSCSIQSKPASLINTSLKFLEQKSSYEIVNNKTDITTFIETPAGESTSKMKITSTFSNDSNIFKQIHEEPNFKIEEYIKNNIAYTKNYAGEWIKYNEATPYIEAIQEMKKLSTFKEDDFTIQEDESTYTLNFKPSDMEDLERKVFVNAPSIDFEKTNIHEYWAILKIDKKTKRPIHFENEIKVDIYAQITDNNNKEEKFNFSKNTTNKVDFRFDSIETIILPPEAENAKDAPQ